MSPFRVIINGSRHYRNYFLFARKLDKMLVNIPKNDILIIEGGANGADYLAYLYAKRRKLKYVTMNADWDQYGKSAGYIRNGEMMKIATHALSFWDGESRGTAHVIREANNYGISLRVVKIPKEVKNGKPKKGNRTRRR